MDVLEQQYEDLIFKYIYGAILGIFNKKDILFDTINLDVGAVREWWNSLSKNKQARVKRVIKYLENEPLIWTWKIDDRGYLHFYLDQRKFPDYNIHSTFFFEGQRIKKELGSLWPKDWITVAIEDPDNLSPFSPDPLVSHLFEGHGSEFAAKDVMEVVNTAPTPKPDIPDKPKEIPKKSKKPKQKVIKLPKLTVSEELLKNFREKDLFKALRDEKNVKKVMDIFESRLAAATTELDQKLMQTAIDAYRLGVERAAGHLGEGLFIETPFGAPAIHTIQYYLDDYTIPALARLSDDVTKAVEGACKDFITNYGQNLTDLEKSIRKSLGESGANVRYRSHVIARTELSRLVNNGYMKHCDDIRPDAKYDWLSNPGACEHCDQIAASGPYPYRELEQITNGFVPHPNCRCRPILHTRFMERKEVKEAKKVISNDLKKHQSRIGSAATQEKRFAQELKAYCMDPENEIDYAKVLEIMKTDEYKAYLKQIQNTTLHHRTKDIDAVLKDGQIKCQKLRNEVGRASLKDPGKKIDEYVFFHETRGSPYYGKVEIVFDKKLINEKYLMEWSREDSIIFKTATELKNAILSTEQYDKMSAAIRLTRGGVSLQRACLGEARVMNAVDITDLDKLILDGGFVGVKRVTKAAIKDYLPKAKALVKEYPWLEGKIYLEVCTYDYEWYGWELLA